MEKEKKKKRGDRTDGYLVRDLDPLHMFMPYLMGSRTENEAVMNEEFDLTEAIKFIEKKNENTSQKPSFNHYQPSS